MLARQEPCRRRSAALSAALILICATAGSAEEIIFDLDPALHFETVALGGQTCEQVQGVDPHQPEVVGIEYIDPPYTFPHAYHNYIVRLEAATIGEGPVSTVLANVRAVGPVGPEGGPSQAYAINQANNRFDFVVFNRFGTEKEHLVPVILEGTLFAQVAFGESEIQPYQHAPYALALAQLRIMEKGGDPFYALDVRARNDYDPDDWTSEESWYFSKEVPLGTQPGDAAYFTVLQNVNCDVAAGADFLGYSFAFAKAYADPFIYIDPTWEHADKFGLAFPDNVTIAIIPEPSALVGLLSMGLMGALGYVWRRRRRAA